MSMTKQDFERIAMVMRNADAIAIGIPNHKQLVKELANELTLTNVRFDRERFVNACKPGWLVGSARESQWENA